MALFAEEKRKQTYISRKRVIDMGDLTAILIFIVIFEMLLNLLWYSSICEMFRYITKHLNNQE